MMTIHSGDGKLIGTHLLLYLFIYDHKNSHTVQKHEPLLLLA